MPALATIPPAMAVLAHTVSAARWELSSPLLGHRSSRVQPCSGGSLSSSINAISARHRAFRIASRNPTIAVAAQAHQTQNLSQNVHSHVSHSNSRCSIIPSVRSSHMVAITSPTSSVPCKTAVASALVESAGDILRQFTNVAASVLLTTAATATLLAFPLDASAAPISTAAGSAAATHALSSSLSPGATTLHYLETLSYSSPGPIAQIAKVETALTAALEPASEAALTLSQSAADSLVSASPVIDGAQLLGSGKREALIGQLEALERETGWRVRVLTRYAPEQFETEALRSIWQPDDRTVVVVLDVTSPNVLNFFAGDIVREKLPRQFFIELQSRYGNQFYVAEQGDTRVLQETVSTLQTCLLKPGGCNNVPGVVDELYFLTLSTAILGGTVFGFAARLEPSGKVEASWQWALIFSPLWLLLLVAFSLLPITARTDDLEPLLKNGAGFLAGAAGMYLTPIFGQSPVANWGKRKDGGTKNGTQSGRESDSDDF